jgi:trehalose synthase
MPKLRPAYLIVVLLCVLFCTACGKGKSPARPETPPPAQSKEKHMPMPRADPGHLQYLERQSMLFKARDMAKVVSGSELAWRSSVAGGPAGMLGYADTWVLMHPMTLLTSSRSTVFNQLADASTWAVLREIGAKGIYVAPLQGSGYLWATGRKGTDTGDDVVQYDFSRVAGNEDQYRRMMQGVISNQSLVGSDLVPAATGLGPDFFLAARGVREYPGIYCMVEIPEDSWTLLPEVTAEWNGASLGQEQVESLNKKGLLPKAMRDEVSLLARGGGWAATGVIRGVDGNNHRWVYRYYQSPEYAVLNWEDPSQSAHRILSGSAVQQVGLQGQALIGMRFDAFQGLEPASEGRTAESFSVEPARTAAQSMGREIHRYGGWSWLRDDNLPLHLIGGFLSSGVDFVFDSVFSPASEHALLTGDAALARFMADEALRLGVDASRLVHVMPAQDGINYALTYLAHAASDPAGEKAKALRDQVRSAMRASVSAMDISPIQDNHLYNTAPGLAALALKAPTPEAANAAKGDIEQGHALLVFFKAMQPGVLMLTGQDLCGVLPLSKGVIGVTEETLQAKSAVRGGYALGSAGLSTVSSTGVPRAPQLYQPPSVQAHSRDSFLRKIGTFLRARDQYAVSRGQLIARPQTKEPGSIALLSRLANGNYLLSLCNFSRKSVNESVNLQDIPGIRQAAARVTPIALGGSHSVSGTKISFSLGPWQGRALLLGTGEKVPAPAELTDGIGEPGRPSSAAPGKQEVKKKKKKPEGEKQAKKSGPAAGLKSKRALLSARAAD